MKKARLLFMGAFALSITGAFAANMSRAFFDLRGNPGSGCAAATNLTAPEFKTCLKQSIGTFCTVTVGGTPNVSAYDGSCTAGNEIKYND